MAQIWSDVLGVSLHDIGRRTSFFALGGDSMSALRVVKLCKDARLHISVYDLLTWNILSQVVATALPVDVEVVWPSIQIAESVKGLVQCRWPEYESCFPATLEQESMVGTIATAPSAFVFQMVLELGQDLDLVAIKYQHLVAQREILRSTFVSTEGGLYHVVQSSSLHVPVARASVATLMDFLSADLQRAFTLDDHAFARFTIVQDDRGRAHGVVTIHHALYDGASITMLRGDIEDALLGRQLACRPPFRHVVEYIAAQDSSLAERYWTRYLDGICKPTLVACVPPFIDPPPMNEALVATLILPNISIALKRIDVSMAALVNLAWATTLRRQLCIDDVVFGQVVSNRSIPVVEVEKTLGCLISSVPCRVEFDADNVTLLQRIQTENAAMLPHALTHANVAKRWGQAEWTTFDTEVSIAPSPYCDHSSMSWCEQRAASYYTIELTVIPLSTQELCVQANFDPNRIDGPRARQYFDTMLETLHQFNLEI
ncbi:hypothetical protein DYB32_008837 [Aphanomyces invadans]|uniref:Carrier domain-containing protein n=1 Tax=Aphanomyces invadans TaxID=157072 RepID=A0A3R7A3T0_9STRA|nr:hypothetical protein DYB32_008837 [Aphanomyces invadans]